MLRGVVTHCASGHGGLDLITRFLLRGNDVKLPRLDSNQDNICLALIQVTSDQLITPRTIPTGQTRCTRYIPSHMGLSPVLTQKIL